MPPEQITEQSTDISTDAFDVDGFMDTLDSSPNTEIPMSAPPAQGEPAPAVAPQEYEITVGGKLIKAPLDKITQWAQQGHDYAQKMQEFNTNRTTFEQEQNQFKEQYGTYQQVDEYARNNPDWWAQVQHQYEARTQNAGVDSQSGTKNPEIEELRNQITELSKFRDDYQSSKDAQTRESEDTKLEGDVKSIRESHKNLDWHTPNAEGKNLEQQVLTHGIQNGIDSFRAAFRDYHFDSLLRSAQDMGKVQITKDIQKQTKLGLLGQTPTPLKGIQSAQNVRQKSYDDLEAEALAEIEQGIV